MVKGDLQIFGFCLREAVDLIFTMRIYWFIHEIGRPAEKTRKEEEFSERYERFEDFEKAWKEYEENIADKTALWPQKSFENFIRLLFNGMQQKLDKTESS